MQKEHKGPADAHEGGFALGFGLERLGLVSLRFPSLFLVLVLVITAFAYLGINRIRVDDSISELFRTDTPEFHQYETLASRFPSSEFDVLIVVEGKDLLARPQVAALSDLVTELQLTDGLSGEGAGLVSLFSAREAPVAGGLPPPLFPDVLPEGAEYDQLIQRVRNNEIIKDKLLSADGQLALIVIALDRTVVESQGLRQVIGELKSVTDDKLKGTGLTAQFSGAPVMQLEIRNAVERDQMTYNVLGLLIGAIIAIIFFRRISLMLLTVLPPVIAVIWSLGVLGWLEFKLNLFLNVMIPLITVMGFSDSMQIVFAMRDRLVKGDSKVEALRYAIRVVGPACVVTNLASALTFTGLILSDSGLIRTFGVAGAIAAVVSFFAVIAILPILGIMLVHREAAIVASAAKGDAAMEGLRSLCRGLARMVTRRPALCAMGGLILLGLFSAAHLSLTPRYRLADQVPDREQAVAASGRLDAKLTGANPVHVLIELPVGHKLYADEALAVIGAVHRKIEVQSGIGNVWSLETLRRWIEEKAHVTDIATLQGYVAALPPHLVRRFIAVDETAVVVTGRMPDVDSSELLPVIEKIDSSMDEVRKAYPGYRISVTGLPAIAARNSAGMIGKLNASLTVEAVFVSAALGLIFRSLFAGAVSLLPGLLPIVASGTLLWALGEGLQFASVVALTVAFGLGLNATIHFLNRLRLETRTGEEPALAVSRSTVLVGPALMLTTIVLACGLAVTVFSDLPSLRLFGWLTAVTLVAALLGDLVFLPASVLVVRRWLRRRSVSS